MRNVQSGSGPARGVRCAEWCALGIGTAYLITSWWTPEIMRLLGVPYPVRVEYLQEHGTRHIVSLIGLQLPALGLLLIVVFRGGASAPLRAVLGGEKRSKLLLVFVLCVISSWFLDALGVWPWTWRDPDASGGYTAFLLTERRWAALLLSAAITGLIAPLIEEVFFRFAVYNLLEQISRSRLIATLGSAMAFSVAHFGPAFRIDDLASARAVYLFAFGVVLATITRRRGGLLGYAIVIHMGRNLSERLALVLALIYS